MSKLSINFAGIKAPNPFWLASGPPTNTAGQVMRAFDCGWGGAVWKTMGVPIVNVSNRYGATNYGKVRMMGLTNIELISDRKFSDNLKDIEEVKKHFPHHPVIASLMVQSKAEWGRAVEDSQNAGADGIELNFSCPHGMNERGMGSSVGQEPKLVELITGWVMDNAKVPVIVKLTPNITDIREPARAAKRGGANAISLINTIKSIIGVDIHNLVPYTTIGSMGTNGGYSGPAVKPIALNMVRSCATDSMTSLPISGIGGIETWQDAVEFMLLGAGSVQVCTAVMHYGFGIVGKMISGLEQYMNEMGFKTVDEIIGKALPAVTDWENLDRNFRVVAKIDAKKCNRCQACYKACHDGAYQAIEPTTYKSDNLSAAKQIPQIIKEKCVGCGLCALVCPVENCISMQQVSHILAVATETIF